MKEYRNMESGEQAQWLKAFSDFLANDYANVKAMGSEWQVAFERGLKVLEPFTICERFVSAARVYRDYERRVQRMGFFIEELRKQVIAVDGSLLAQAAAPQKRRVGRPTKKEQMAMQQERVLKDSGKMDAVMQIAGMKEQNGTAMELPGNGRRLHGEIVKNGGVETVKRDEGMMGDLFDDNNRDNGITSSRDNAEISQTSNLQPQTSNLQPANRLQDIKYLLRGELADEVDRIAVVRSQAATESELAKEAALAGKPQSEVEVHAHAAGVLTAEYENIYAMIDKDLAGVYIEARLAKTEMIGNELREVVMEKTEHYYRKVVESDPAFEGMYLARLANGGRGTGKNGGKEKAAMPSPDNGRRLHGETAKNGDDSSRGNREAQGENRESQDGKTAKRELSKEEKRMMKNYHDYFYRKDVKPSEARVRKMEEKIEEMKKMGVNVLEFEVILEKERERVLSNV